MSDYLLTYYGDDFTGSTDVMESLVIGGVPTVLFLEPPPPEIIRQHFSGMRAVGVAGISRTMTRHQMTDQLTPIFDALKRLGAPLFHYKICSTFDSSPTIGSIGHAIEIGQQIFQSPVVPLIVGAPALKRYVVFGNLFATVGEETYRLDRHPTMSKHPVTPMHESDLRLHLSKQTQQPIALIDLLQFNATNGDLVATYQALAQNGNRIILLDTISHDHLHAIGRLIWENRGTAPSLIVGSSGVEHALTMHWRHAGVVQDVIQLQAPPPVDQIVVICGSAAYGTMHQIQWAIVNGFHGIRLDTPALIHPHKCDHARSAAIDEALRALGDGKSIILYSALGPEDPAIQQTRLHYSMFDTPAETISSILGRQQGIILRTILERTNLKRACVAGGDTSGHVAQQLGIYALEMLVPIAPGAPLCRASSRDDRFNGLQISFKGGQNGGKDYFGAILRGHA